MKDIAVGDLKAFALPLDGYLPTDDQRRVLVQARNEIYLRCMADFGFVIPAPPVDSRPPRGPNEQRYGLVDETEAAQHGYHNPIMTAQSRPSEPPMSPAEEAVSTGTGPSTHEGRQVPAGGCLGEASRVLAKGAPTVDNVELAQRLSLDSFHESRADSRVRRVFAEWSGCMNGAGYDYATPSDANNDPAFRTEQTTDREIAVAVADVRCKEQVNLVNLWASVEVAYQRRAIEKHAEALKKLRTARDVQLANAARIVAGG